MFHSLWAMAEGGFWMPEQASTMAPRIDGLFSFILALCTIFFVAIVGTMIYFVIRYRRRDPNQRTSPNSGNLRLEIAWSVVPAVLLVVLFVWGFREFMAFSAPPSGALDIRVTAQTWNWSFEYPEGIESDKLVVPVDQPVKLTMASRDVIHSFYVPAFRVKQDVIPNRYTVTWFQATKPGTYDVLCAEYCGTGHSEMHTTVQVLSAEEYAEWVNKGGPLGEVESPIEKGRLLFRIKGCNQCHSVSGEMKVGPPLDGKYGGTETLTDGSSVDIDDNYIRSSILEPNAQIVQGFSPKMPTFQGRIKDNELNWIIDYLKSIGK
jgi:cytochrome c oxidase subunit 2